MGLLKKIFGKNSSPVTKQLSRAYSKNDIAVISESAGRLVKVLNESLKLANESNNPETKLSRLGVAKQKLSEIKKLASEYPFLTLTSLNEVERDIDRLTLEFELEGYRAIAEGNILGEQLEKEGKIDEAISQYERLLEQKVDTPFTYRRLAILYKKKTKPDDELRAIRAALKNVPRSNAAHYKWFQNRMAKFKEK